MSLFRMRPLTRFASSWLTRPLPACGEGYFISAREPPAVHHQDGAVTVVGCGGREEHRGPAHVGGRTPAAGRDAGKDGRIAGGVVADRLRVVGRAIAGRDRVDVDALAGPL